MSDILSASAPEIPDYEFPSDALIGEGAYGQVWYGIYKEDQPRAVKVYKAGALKQDRWRAEYEKLKALDEPPGIITLYDQGMTAEGLPFVAMRLMADEHGPGGWKGRTLDQRIHADTLDDKLKWKLILDIADTLAYLHRQGVIHCDVKPSNVLLSGGDEPRAVLCDFGQSIDEGYSPKELSGTLLFASPEQLRREDSRIESWDVYSFGVSAYQVITGRLPRLHEFNEQMRTAGAASVLDTMASLFSDSIEFKRSIDRELIPLVMQEAISAEREVPMPNEVIGTDREKDFEVILQCLAIEGDQPPRFRNMTEVREAFRAVARRKVVSVERRKKIVYATLMVFGMIAAGIAGWQWLRAESSRRDAELYGDRAAASAVEQQRLAGVAKDQRDEAERQRSKAEENARVAEAEKTNAVESEEVARLARSTAEVLINNMLYDLKDQLEPLGRVDLLEQVSKDAETYFSELPESQRTDESERERSAMLINRAEVLTAVGAFEEAEDVLKESLRIREDLLNNQGTTIEGLRDLSVTHERLGDIQLIQGYLEAAKQNYKDCLEIRQLLSASAGDPQSKRRTSRDVGVAQLKISGVLARLGEVGSSITVADDALVLFRELEKGAEGLFGTRRDLGVTLMQCGDLYLENDRADRALECYAESAQLFESLLEEANPDNASIRRDFAAALVRIGEWYEQNGDIERAASYLGRALPMVRQLAILDPDNLEQSRNLGLLLTLLGQVSAQKEANEEASEYFSESMVLLGRLVEHSEPQPVWLEDAHASLVAWGDLYRELGEWSAAVKKYAESLSLARRRLEFGPEDEAVRVGLVVSLYRTAQANREAGDEAKFEKSQANLAEALQLLSELEDGIEGWESVIKEEMNKFQ